MSFQHILKQIRLPLFLIYTIVENIPLILQYTSFLNARFALQPFILISWSGVLLNPLTGTLAFDLLLCYNSFTYSLSLRSKVKNKNLYLATFASVLGPMSFGFVLGYSSPAIPELTSIDDPRLRLNSDQASWFGVWRRISRSFMSLLWNTVL